MWKYDPCDFICNRRQKNKMAPYIHHQIPEIEKYANQLEWVENTLVDRDSPEVAVENALIDLEKGLEEGSFLQVPRESQVQTESQVQSESHIEEESQVQEESEQPYLSEELGQTSIQQHTMSTPPNLQTPLNEEKSLKRNREEATTSGRATIQTYAETNLVKRQRLNPVSEQEFTEETVGATSTEIKRSRPATASWGTLEPSTSHTQMLERQRSVEVSSFRMPANKDQDIRERYKGIKARNERLKAQTYSQYLKMAPNNQRRLMSAYGVKEGKMQMTFMKPTTQQPRSAADYKKIDFGVLLKDIHPIE